MFTRGVHGPDAVKEVVSELVQHSVSFSVMPLPDDDWDITVKPEAARLLETIIAYEEGEIDPDEERRMLQGLINAGTWGLQGSYGRAMMDCIEAGACVLGHDGATDYWGNYIPSRTEVQPGSIGSIEFAQAQGWDVLD